MVEDARSANVVAMLFASQTRAKACRVEALSSAATVRAFQRVLKPATSMKFAVMARVLMRRVVHAAPTMKPVLMTRVFSTFVGHAATIDYAGPTLVSTTHAPASHVQEPRFVTKAAVAFKP